MSETLYMTKGPRASNDHRTNGYLLTLTPHKDGYKARWDYPNDPYNPNDNGVTWSLVDIQSNIRMGLWKFRHPPVLNLPNGA